MNKKGFTLVELMAVIVVLGIVIAIATRSVIGIRNESLNKAVLEKISQLENSGILYGQENPDELNSNCSFNIVVNGEDSSQNYEFCKKITAGELIDKGFFKSGVEGAAGNLDLKNDLTGLSMRCDTIYIYRKNNRIYASIPETKEDGKVLNSSNKSCNETITRDGYNCTCS